MEPTGDEEEEELDTFEANVQTLWDEVFLDNEGPRFYHIDILGDSMTPRMLGKALAKYTLSTPGADVIVVSSVWKPEKRQEIVICMDVLIRKCTSAFDCLPSDSALSFWMRPSPGAVPLLHSVRFTPALLELNPITSKLVILHEIDRTLKEGGYKGDAYSEICVHDILPLLVAGNRVISISSTDGARVRELLKAPVKDDI